MDALMEQDVNKSNWTLVVQLITITPPPPRGTSLSNTTLSVSSKRSDNFVTNKLP